MPVTRRSSSTSDSIATLTNSVMEVSLRIQSMEAMIQQQQECIAKNTANIDRVLQLYETMHDTVQDLATMRRPDKLSMEPSSSPMLPTPPCGSTLSSGRDFRPPHAGTSAMMPEPAEALSHVRLPRIDVPMFQGTDVESWLFQIEKYFDHYGIPVDQRLLIATFYMSGDALKWLQWMYATRQIGEWSAFVSSIMVRFGPPASPLLPSSSLVTHGRNARQQLFTTGVVCRESSTPIRLPRIDVISPISPESSETELDIYCELVTDVGVEVGSIEFKNKVSFTGFEKCISPVCEYDCEKKLAGFGNCFIILPPKPPDIATKPKKPPDEVRPMYTEAVFCFLLESLFVAALYALLNLGIGNDLNKAAIVKVGAVHKLLNLIQGPRYNLGSAVSDAIVTNFLGLSALDSTKPIIGSSGAIPFLVSILKDKDNSSAQSRQDAMRALYNLTICHSNVLFVLETDLIEYLLNVMGDMEVSERGLAILSNVASTPDCRKAISTVRDTFQILVDVLNWTDAPGCQEKATYILMVMSHKAYGDRRAMVDAGVMSALLELTLLGTTSAQKRASRILALLRVDKGKQISESFSNVNISAPLHCYASSASNGMQPTPTELCEYHNLMALSKYRAIVRTGCFGHRFGSCVIARRTSCRV